MAKLRKDGKPDGRSRNGGVRKGQGRKSKALELQTNEIMKKAIKQLYDTNTVDEAKIALIQDLLGTQRGLLFVAEHIFGKPTDNIKLEGGENPIQIKLADLVSFTPNNTKKLNG